MNLIKNSQNIQKHYNEYQFSPKDSLYNFITCQLMKYNNTNVITCFFATSLLNNENNNFINVTVFNPENNFEIIQSNVTNTKNISKFHNLKSSVMTVDGRTKALACAMITIDTSLFLFYVGYDIISNRIYDGYIINPQNCTIKTWYLYFSLSYFKEIEEYITSFKCELSSSYVYLVYSFNNNFKYSFYGTISDFISSDLNSCCNNFPLETTNVLHNFLFSSLAQKYCLIEISSLFILNKDIKIVNPAEKKPIYPLQNVTCENYSDIKVIQNIHNFETMKNIEKCTTNFFSLKKACPDINFINKTFEFSFSCSAKFPYEINETHRCVEYCNNDSLLKGECKSSFLNDGSFDNISDIVSSINNDYNEGNIYDNTAFLRIYIISFLKAYQIVEIVKICHHCFKDFNLIIDLFY